MTAASVPGVQELEAAWKREDSVARVIANWVATYGEMPPAAFIDEYRSATATTEQLVAAARRTA